MLRAKTFQLSDFQRDAYTGDVDTLTGYAVVASRETCFVWNYAQVNPSIHDPARLHLPRHVCLGPERYPDLLYLPLSTR